MLVVRFRDVDDEGILALISPTLGPQALDQGRDSLLGVALAQPEVEFNVQSGQPHVVQPGEDSRRAVWQPPTRHCIENGLDRADWKSRPLHIPGQSHTLQKRLP